MSVEVLQVDAERPDPAALDAAAEAVLRGGVIAFPSDSLYVLGCSLLDVSAVELIARMKRRGPGKAVISLIPEPSQAHGLALVVNPVARRLMDSFWPGPLSLIFLAASIVPVGVQGRGGTVALRCPRDPLCQALLARVGGPVVASSANLSGQPPAQTAEEVRTIFGNPVDLILDGGPRRRDVPTTLVDVSRPRPRLLRRGALEVDALLGVFEDLSEQGG